MEITFSTSILTEKEANVLAAIAEIYGADKTPRHTLSPNRALEQIVPNQIYQIKIDDNTPIEGSVDWTTLEKPESNIKVETTEGTIEANKLNDNIKTPTVGVVPLPPTQDLGVDINGHIWDDRIHASSKSKLKDGTWKLKRGVEAALINSVLAEQKVPLPPKESPVVVPPPPSATTTASPVSTESATPAATTAPSTNLTYADVMKRIIAFQKDAKVTLDDLRGVYNDFGIGGAAEIKDQPELWQVLLDQIQIVADSKG